MYQIMVYNLIFFVSNIQINHIQRETNSLNLYTAKMLLQLKPRILMKYFTLLTCTVLAYATSIQTKTFSDTVKKHAQETLQTVDGKTETNLFTLLTELDTCHERYDQYNPKCVERVLAKVKKEQTKNNKAMLDCFIAITVGELISAGCKDAKLTNVGTAVRGTVAVPAGFILGFLTTEQIALFIMEFIMKAKLKELSNR